jgi:hypothetical protein
MSINFKSRVMLVIYFCQYLKVFKREEIVTCPQKNALFFGCDAKDKILQDKI